MKVTYSSENINSLGGINFADRIVENAGVYKIIDQVLGGRGVKAIYRYSDLIWSYLLLTLSGGECAEDITGHLRKELGQVKGFEVCSADTLLRMQKELATEKEISISQTGIEHEFNINMRMNRLMLRLLTHTGQLSSQYEGYTLDYDNQFTPTEKFDSKRSYKHVDGYFPGIASIGNFPVYIENRNGNSNLKYKQEETLKRAYGLLSEFGIKRVKYSRMDCGSFDREVIPVVEANCDYFFIRAQRCDNLYGKILHENTVFLVMMAICRNLFHFLTDFISKRLDFIKPSFRLKKFIFRFMVVQAKWIRRGRQDILKLLPARKYHLLLE